VVNPCAVTLEIRKTVEDVERAVALVKKTWDAH
jgi:hypothetical protein